jgi:glucokinase
VFRLVSYQKNCTFAADFNDKSMNQATTNKRVIGVDVSLDATTYAIVDVRGNILAQDSFPTEDYPEINGFVSKLCENILLLIEAHGGIGTIRSVGISVPSANFQSGCIVNAPNMPWKGVIPLSAMMRDRLGLAVAVGNNSNIVALSEHSFGCAHGMKDFAVVTLGSGVGSCFFSNGHIHVGADGFAGEVGHCCIVRNGRPCGCGKKGCLEAYTASKGIVLTAQEVMDEHPDEPTLMRQADKLSPKLIAAYCNQGDPLAQEVMRRTGEILGFGLANCATVLNPEAFIFAGGVAQSAKWFLEYAQNTFEQHVFHNIVGKVKFIPSNLENRTRNMLGASVLAWGVKEYSLFK